MAEGVGFEPTGSCEPPVFKTGAFDRSAIPPRNTPTGQGSSFRPVFHLVKCFLVSQYLGAVSRAAPDRSLGPNHTQEGTRPVKVWNWPRDRTAIERFFSRAESAPSDVEHAVDDIIAAIRRRGDRAVAQFTRRFDGVRIDPGDFDVPPDRWVQAWRATPPRLRRAMRTAKRRIEAFHRRQILKGWSVQEQGFGRIEQRVLPLRRVAVYVPGGRAPLPSTVLMCVLPARVAGVESITLASPPGPGGWPHRDILAAARLAGVDRLVRIGGAQAIAALALGTESLPRVDKIVGPGNIFVATAKKRLFGHIDIDSVAGPSEVLILADTNAPLDWIAADMLAQAEHGEDSSAGAVLVGADAGHAAALRAELNRQLRTLPRKGFARPALRRHGFIVTAQTVDQALEIADLKAPEHLEIMLPNARRLARRVRNAGAVFAGPWTPEALGDYTAGPNHTLPTGGTARFFSPLSVWSFYRTSHTIEATPQGLRALADATLELAEAEGLTAHAETVRRRRATP